MLQSLSLRVIITLTLLITGISPAMAMLAPGRYIPPGEEVVSIALTDIFEDSLYASQGPSLMSGVILGKLGITEIQVDGVKILVALGFLGFGQFQSSGVNVEELALASMISFFAGSEEIYFTGGIGYDSSGNSYSLIFDTTGSGTPVPEPTTFAMAALGLAGLGAVRRRHP